MNRAINTYKTYSTFYDAYMGKYDADLDFYQSHCNQSESIIEIGCGTGRILEFMLRQGYRLTGVDISQEMLDKANVKLRNWIDTGQLELNNYDFSIGSIDGQFDKALLSYFMFNYVLENPADFLSNIYDSLNFNGLLLMDMLYPHSLVDPNSDGKWGEKDYHFDGFTVRSRECRTLINNMEHRQQIMKIENKEVVLDTWRRYYSPVELKKILTTVGFKSITFSNDYDYKSFRPMINVSNLRLNYIVRARK